MDTFRFKPTPTDTHFQTPFDLTEKALNQWLNSLENNLESEKSQQILLAIQAINKEDTLPAPKKSLLLESIHKTLAANLKPLHTTILNSALPLSSEEKSSIEHIVWIYAELANGFAMCITNKSSLANAQTLFYGLQSLISAYIHISEVYQQPFTNFWKQSYLFYGLACQLEIQDLNIEQHSFHIDTINNAFKHLLALYHCGLDQFRPRDMLTISTCIEKYTPLMLIDKNFSRDNVSQYSVFDLNSGTPPTALSRLKKTEKSALRFFSAYTAATKICKNAHEEASGTGILKSINHENILQSVKTLSLSQKRRFTRFNEQQTRNGIIGFNNIIKELDKTSTLAPATKNHSEIDKNDPRVAGGWQSPDLELVTEGYESLDAMKSKLGQTDEFTGKHKQVNQAKQLFSANNKTYKHDNDIWNNIDSSKQQELSPLDNPELDISDSSIKGYKIIFDTDDNTSRVQIGDIIGIRNNDAIEIGIIRRILQLTEHKLQLGIKLLALESEIAYISLPKHESINAWALFLPGIKALNSKDSIIFDDNQFQSGEFINLHQADQEVVSCRLSKLLHLSCAGAHIELFNSNLVNEF